MSRPGPALARLRALPRGIWALGFVSLFMDVSSEMIHGLLPVFLVQVLGASALALGLVEGIAESAASLTKLLSGALSDRLGRRKPLAVAGYALAAATKPLFALAPSVGWVLAARASDRVAKGLRGAPRDALVADITPGPLRGAAYGLRQALDTVGAFAGPLLAVALMRASGDDFRLVFWVALAPALVSVVVLIFAVDEPARPHAGAQAGPAPVLAGLGRLGPACWAVIVVGALLTLARFSEAFLVLRLSDLGLPLALAPLVLVVMNLVYALTSYPMGALSDSGDRGRILAVGFAVLIVADLALAAASGPRLALLGVALWGLHLGMTQGLLGALVADTAPEALRGTAFGAFHLASGVAVLLASVLAGALWDRLGAPATFLTGAALAALGLAALLLVAGHPLRPR
jgi:MFS family permease